MRKRKIYAAVDIRWQFKRHHEVCAGIQKVAEERGWDAVILPVSEEFLCDMDKWGFEGIVGRVSPEVAATAKKRNIPVVNVWLNSGVRGVPNVFPDWEIAGDMAARHLLSRGFKNFSYLGLRNDRSSESQWSGFRAVLKEKGYRANKLLLDPGYDLSQSQWDMFSDQLGQWIDSFTVPCGICVVGDLLGRLLADFCRRKGLNIPSDVAILSSQNEHLLSGKMEPTLSSIDLNFERIGEIASDMLGTLMDGGTLDETEVLVPPAKLVMRSSTDVYAVDDALVSDALRFISENSHQPIQVEDVAEYAGVSRRTLERRFSESLGPLTIAREITRLRVERTKRNLLDESLSLRQIAEQNGFCDSSHLCTVFMRETGQSPMAWRNAHIEQAIGKF